jgi:iron complex outermembrane receptor protein
LASDERRMTWSVVLSAISLAAALSLAPGARAQTTDSGTPAREGAPAPIDEDGTAEPDRQPDAGGLAEPDLDLDAADTGVLRTTPTEGVEEITITGEVLESSTQAEPEAITTFDQEELDTLGIATVDTLALNTPSLHVGQVGQQAVITLRGIGLENLTSIGEAGVGFEVDGVHIGRPSGSNATFFDLERVDVLRGPQGTRGGRNLTAGRIALYSKKPGEDLDASIDATFGNYRHFQTRAVLNVPVWQEYLRTRASFLLDQHDGYQENVFFGLTDDNRDDSQDVAVRLQALSLLFDETVEARGIYYYNQQGGNGPAAKLIGPPPSPADNTVAEVVKNPANHDYIRSEPADPSDPLAFQVPGTNQFIKSTCEPAHPDFAQFKTSVQRDTQQWICNPSDARQAFAETVGTRDNEQTGFTGHLTWNVPYWADSVMSDIQVKFIGSSQNLIADSTNDFDVTNIPDSIFELRSESDQVQFELYAERPDVDFFDFKTGFFYFKEDINTDVCLDSRGSNTIAGSDVGINTKVTTESMAGYLNVGFRPVDALRFFGGVRYIDESKSSDQILERYGQASATSNPTSRGNTRASRSGCATRILELLRNPLPRGIVDVAAGECPNGVGECISFEDQYNAWTPAFGAEWQVTEDSSLGFSISKGWKAGGFALGASSLLDPDLQEPYDSEEVWSYELSAKNELFNGLVRLNVAAFWTEYEPFQVCQFAGAIFFCRSDGGATIRGIEVEWLANPIEALQLNGHFNYIDSRINNFQLLDPTDRDCSFAGSNAVVRAECEAGLVEAQPPIGGFTPTDVTGNSLSRSPAWAGSFGMQYTLDFGRWGYMTPRIQTQFQGKTYYRVFNKDELSQDPFAKLDLKLMWASENDRFKAELFVYNLTDEDVINSIIIGPRASGGQGLAQYQAPRTFGIQIGVNYVADLLQEFF